MQRTGFLAKTAFICNLFFVICLLLQRRPETGQGEVVSLIAILGIVLGMFIANPLTNIINGVALLKGKPLFQWVPRWLAITNFCFLLFQIIYLLRTWS